MPQIQATCDVDANGILRVSPSDNTTGPSNHNTITNDKGHISKGEIKCMVSEAEKDKDEDEDAASRIQARNGLDSYAYSLHNPITHKKLVCEAKLLTPIDELASSLEGEMRGRGKELEGVLAKIYDAASGAPSSLPLLIFLVQYLLSVLLPVLSFSNFQFYT
ncbi:Hsp70 protein-domain-containing protein [Flagelloscypha sp. PMI_526]|nr:Hsp70 protein-domain-containing protein [Flagelloscypha sp. PMI_526]